MTEIYANKHSGGVERGYLGSPTRLQSQPFGSSVNGNVPTSPCVCSVPQRIDNHSPVLLNNGNASVLHCQSPTLSGKMIGFPQQSPSKCQNSFMLPHSLNTISNSHMQPHSPNKSTYSHSLQHPHNNIANNHSLHHLPLSPSKVSHFLPPLQNNEMSSSYCSNTGNADISRYLTESPPINGTPSNYLPMGNLGNSCHNSMLPSGNSHNSMLPSGNSLGGNGNYSGGNNPSSNIRVNDTSTAIEAAGTGDNYIDQPYKGLETTLQTAADLQNIIANSRSFNGYENFQSKTLDRNKFNNLSSPRTNGGSRSSVRMSLQKPLDPRSLDIQFSDNTNLDSRNIDSRGDDDPTECLLGNNPTSHTSLLRSPSSHHVQLCPITSLPQNENMVPLTELPLHKRTSIGSFSSSNLPARSYGMPNSGSNGRLSRSNSVKATEINQGKVGKSEKKEKGSLSSNGGNGCCKVLFSLLLCLLIFGSAIFGIVYYLHSE